LQTALRKIGDYVIRRCEEQDLPAVIDINMSALPEHYSDYFFESILRELPEAFIIAELGFVKKGHVVSVAVLEEHRGKGLGKALMLEGINGVMHRRGDEIYLEVRVSNTGAIKMYERLRFEIKSRLRSYYRDGEDAYLMALELN
jgi:ribosomal-protein-alanine N-acetyltransferase